MDEEIEDKVGATQAGLRCNGMEVMWRKVAQVAGDGKGWILEGR
jgi:hypothetical protein